MKAKPIKLLCGCAYLGHTWTAQCEKHKAETEMVHKQWAEDHKRTMALRYPNAVTV